MSESPEERMANNKVYSVDAFAAGIKSNHPEYAEIDNQELVGKMLEKYPQYRSQVDYAPTGGWQDKTPKKKILRNYLLLGRPLLQTRHYLLKLLSAMRLR